MKKTVLLLIVPDEPADATTSPSFDLDVFPGDSIILRCVANREICAGHSIEHHRDAELLCCAGVSTSSKNVITSRSHGGSQYLTEQPSTTVYGEHTLWTASNYIYFSFSSLTD